MTDLKEENSLGAGALSFGLATARALGYAFLSAALMIRVALF